MAYAKNFKYSYEGSVMEFDRITTTQWFASTYAPSETKARSNLRISTRNNSIGRITRKSPYPVRSYNTGERSKPS